MSQYKNEIEKIRQELIHYKIKKNKNNKKNKKICQKKKIQMKINQ